MGLDYAIIHFAFTLPPAIILTIILSPLWTRLDIYKTCFLITIAVVYTIPWDAYLIYSKIWTYPPNAILGPTLIGIPLEELFFFFIQTYITSLLYILFNKSTLFAAYIRNEKTTESHPLAQRMRYRKVMGQVFFASMSTVPLFSKEDSKSGTYIRLICLWAGPVLLFLWTQAHQLLLGLPQSKTRLPIAISTLYFWLVDTIALHRGTWRIESGTKLGIQLWAGLEIEEAVFFLLTNTLIVFGLCAFDNAVTILETFPDLFPVLPAIPSPKLLVEALLVPTPLYDSDRLAGIGNSMTTLAKKSRSFYLASGVFSGRLRIDLILLYAFCRVADDLVDGAKTSKDAERWINHLSQFLKTAYSPKQTDQSLEAALAPFSTEARSILVQLPVKRLPSQPFYTLLEGFRSDIKFKQSEKGQNSSSTPIKTESDLELYASRVASTVAEQCLHLVYYHSPSSSEKNGMTTEKSRCFEAGKRMGIALQYVNIVRDVTTDAIDGRCYIPSEWFSKEPPRSAKAFQEELLFHRRRVLETAFQIYRENRSAIEELPEYAKNGIRVAVESYMEIGRVMKEAIQRGDKLDMAGGGREGRASVPKSRRFWVGWRTMMGPAYSHDRVD